MDNQVAGSGQIPQFDPTATPPPPTGTQGIDQPQALGAVVEPTAPANQSIAQLETAVGRNSSPSLPPPPFEQPRAAGQPIQPTIPSPANDAVQPTPQNQEFTLPTAESTSPAAFDESKFVTDPSPVPPATADDTQSNAAPKDDDQALPNIDDVVQSNLGQQSDSDSGSSADSADELASDQSTDSDSPPRDIVDPAAARVAEGNLEIIKQQALRELAPIANQLDQEPIDRFHTLLELIQATDNHDLVQGAFDAAQSIDDDRERATALLNLVNEVTYLEKLKSGQSDSDSDDSEDSDASSSVETD